MFEDMVVDAANTYQQTDGETLADGGVNFKKKVGNNNSLWYNKNEIYSPVAWVLNNELLTGAEIVQFNSTLAEIKKQGGQPWKRLNKGEVIVDVGAKLIVAKGTMEQPHILDVISYVGQKETQNNFEIFKESIKDAINIRENRERSVALVEDIVDFYVSLNETELARYYFRDFATAEGYDFYGEGFIRKNNDRSGSGELIERGDSSRNSEGDRKSKKITYQIKENVSSTKTFFESMADMVSQETTELYDRLSEAVEKHYGTREAAERSFDPSVDFEGTSFVYTSPDQAQRKIEQQIADFESENEFSADEIEYCKMVANGERSAIAPDEQRAEIYKELIGLYKASEDNTGDGSVSYRILCHFFSDTFVPPWREK